MNPTQVIPMRISPVRVSPGSVTTSRKPAMKTMPSTKMTGADRRS